MLGFLVNDLLEYFLIKNQKFLIIYAEASVKTFIQELSEMF